MFRELFKQYLGLKRSTMANVIYSFSYSPNPLFHTFFSSSHQYLLPYLPFQPSFPVFLRNGSDQKRTSTDHPHHHHHSHPLVSVPIFSHLLPVTMNEKSLALNPCGLYTRSHPSSYSKIATSSSLHHRRSHPLGAFPFT